MGRLLVVNEAALEKLLSQWRHGHEFILEERSFDFEEALKELDADEAQLREEMIVAELSDRGMLGEAVMIEYTPPSE